MIKQKLVIKKVNNKFHIWINKVKENQPVIILNRGEENKVKLGNDFANNEIEVFIFISNKAKWINGQEGKWNSDQLFFWNLDSTNQPTWIRYPLEQKPKKNDYFVIRNCSEINLLENYGKG